MVNEIGCGCGSVSIPVSIWNTNFIKNNPILFRMWLVKSQLFPQVLKHCIKIQLSIKSPTNTQQSVTSLTGACIVSEKRRYHIRYRAYLHIHARTWPQAGLSDCRWRHETRASCQLAPDRWKQSPIAHRLQAPRRKSAVNLLVDTYPKTANNYVKWQSDDDRA